MICPNCGGEFADWALKCPYCGSVNDKGAEKEYMKHMDELRKRLDNLDEESAADYNKSMSKTIKRLLIAIGTILAAAAVILIIVFVIKKNETQKSDNFYIAEKAWQTEEYKKLDAMYDEGDYDGILEEYYETLNGDYSITSWKHYCYVTDFYYNYSQVLGAKEQFDDGSGDYYMLGSGIYSALYLTKSTAGDYISRLEDAYNDGSYGLSKDEADLVRQYQAYSLDFLENTLGWSANEIDSFYEENSTNGYLESEPCYIKANEIADSYGWITE